MKIMQIYVINLNRSEDRLRLIKAQMQNLGLEFVRVEAIDGSKLDEAELKARQDCKKAYISSVTCQILNEVACNLSHAKVLELIANGTDEYGVVLEDDALLSKNAAQFLQDSSWIPANTALVKLDIGCKKVLLRHEMRINEEYELYRCRSSNYVAVGYIISRQAARDLYPLLQNTALAVDVLYYSFEFGLAKQLQVLQLYPAILRQSGAASEIQHLAYKKGWNKAAFIYMYKRWHSKVFSRYLDIGRKYKWCIIPCPLLK
ncbi:glycosyltransferase family 25 protein [Bartonella sp. TP]|uniref:glycosyltransferase family 25 protein n=1 Tax=Bartonella sp. TP TaxID=3057550 RepID=UPI0025B0CC3F|nr:glycosyltransferase family 25 protein [Bartonella sp. TP]WJW80441.1 glycosyltransferase family 25 protein [Bartonella sp. TP]